MRKILMAILASAVTVAVAAPSIADAQMRRLPGEGQSGQIGQSRFNAGAGGRQGGFGQGNQFRQHQGGGFRQGGQRYGRGGYGGGYRHRDGNGAAIGAGIAGLAAGALIGGALANQNNGYYEGGGYYGNGYGAAPAYGYAVPVQSEDDAVPVASEGETVAYCQGRFKSYDVASGTYLGYDGQRHACP